MKKSVIFLASMAITMIAAGQKQRILEEITITPPKFSGAETFVQGNYFKSVDDYLRNTVQYPQEAVNNGTEGTEVLKFVITSLGKLADFIIINSVSDEFDEEVIRTLKMTGGMWQPGSINGKPVDMEKEVAVTFKLHPTDDFVAMAKKYLDQGNKMLMKGNPGKALKLFDKGINVLPNEQALLAVRGLCRYQLGDEDGAIRDMNRLKSLGYFDNPNADNEYLSDNYKDLKGYAEISVLKRIWQNSSSVFGYTIKVVPRGERLF
jgi:TonB family protein